MRSRRQRSARRAVREESHPCYTSWPVETSQDAGRIEETSPFVVLERVTPVLLVFLLHGSAAAFYILHGRVDDLPEYWNTWTVQASLLVAASAGVSLVALLTHRVASRALLVAFQILLYVIGLYGEASFPIPLLAWGTALVVEVHQLFSRRSALIASLFTAFVSVLLPRAGSVWNVTIGSPQLVDRLGTATYYVIVVYLTATYTRFRTQRIEERGTRDQMREALLRLTDANVGFQDYAVSAERRGVEDERHRITREIHDTIGYTLTNIIMMTKAAEELIERDHDVLRRLLGDAREQCQDALVETRRTLRAFWAMKTPTVDFPNQIWKTVHTFKLATGIDVQLEFRNLPDVSSPEVRSALHRTLQESLTNAFRHGHATQVTVLFWYDGKRVVISIRDNGNGSKKFKEDIGIGGMRERIEPLGGTVQAQSPAGGGFVIRAWIPLKQNKNVRE